MNARKAIVIAIMLAVSVFAGLFVRGYGTLGQTQNGGIIVTIGHGYGLELWGTPGFFDCNDSGC